MAGDEEDTKAEPEGESEPGANRVEFLKSAAKELSKFDKTLQGRMMSKIAGLADDPRPPGCKALQGTDGYRVRRGDYRILYTIDDTKRIITIAKVADRKDAYRRR